MENQLVRKICILFLWISIVFFLSGLAILSFYNHACADDYIALTWNRQFGFIGYQKYVYLHWGGRYVSNILASVFSHHDFLISHYYFHTLLLLTFTLASIYYLISVANRYYVNNSIGFLERITFSALFCVNMDVVYPELATGLFWFSSAITYQTSVILLVLFLGVSVSLYHCEPKKKPFLFFVLLVLIIITNGTNELAVLLSGVILLLMGIFGKSKLKKWWLSIAVIVLVYVTSFAFTSLAPGNKERLALFGNTGFHLPYAIAATLFRIFIVYWNIFQSPLFWISLVAIFIYGYNLKGKIVLLKIQNINRQRVLIFIASWTVLFSLILLPILVISNGSIPDRALNLLAFACILVFFIVSAYWGISCQQNVQLRVLGNPKIISVVLLVLSCTICANRGSKEIAASLISARNYSLILGEREQEMTMAHKKGLDSVSLPLLDSAMNIAVGISAQKATIKEWMKKKPSLLYFEDDMADSSSRNILQQYYKMKVVSVAK